MRQRAHLKLSHVIPKNLMNLYVFRISSLKCQPFLWGLTKPLGAFLGSLSGEVHREISPPSLLCYIDLQVAQEQGWRFRLKHW